MKKIKWKLVLMFGVLFIFLGVFMVKLLKKPTTTPEHIHTFSKEWSYNDNIHYHLSTCEHNIKSEEAKHTFDDGVVNELLSNEKMVIFTYTCSVCKYQKNKEVLRSELVYKITTSINNSEAGTITLYNEYTYMYGEKIILEANVNVGYKFDGWYEENNKLSSELIYEFSMPLHDVKLEAHFFPNTETKYVVNHFKQEIDGSYLAIPSEIEYLYGVTNTLTKIEPKNYEGFTGITPEQKIINADGTTVINIFYTRNTYKLTLIYDEDNDMILNFKYKYGEIVIPFELPEERNLLLGWQYGDDIVHEIKIEKDTTLRAVMIDKIDCEKLSDGTYKIVKYYGYISDFKIPDIVSVIGGSAFQSNNYLITLEIPDSVVEIGRNAFEGCSNLKSVVIGQGVESIGTAAFCDCNSLEDVTIKEGVIYIGNYAFQHCDSLESINLPNSIEEMGYACFDSCINLKSVVLPRNCTTIPNAMFQMCKKLSDIYIPDTVTKIGDRVFYLCESLTNINLPRSLEYIDGSFEKCTKLKEIVIPSNVMKIESDAFFRCDNLSSIIVAAENKYYDSRYNCNAIIDTGTNRLIIGCATTEIPDDVVYIGPYAFKDCIKLTNIKIPDSVEVISSCAFSGCINLVNMELSKNLRKIERSAFEHCYKLANIELPNTLTEIGLSAFSGCESFTSIRIPNGISKINSSTFEDCTNLTSIYIPISVESIGSFAFRGIDNLTLYCEATSRPILWDIEGVKNIVWGYKEN